MKFSEIKAHKRQYDDHFFEEKKSQKNDNQFNASQPITIKNRMKIQRFAMAKFTSQCYE